MNDDGVKSLPTLAGRLGLAEYDVEHAINIYADGFCIIPAEAIYDRGTIDRFRSHIESSHIYMIGFVPKVVLHDIRKDGSKLELEFHVLGRSHVVKYDIPSNFQLVENGGYTFLEDPEGRRFWPDNNESWLRLNKGTGWITFDVKYIGQAYGDDGSRNALDRLKNHEKLQKIALQGVPEGYCLTLMMVTVMSSNRVITSFNPHAKSVDDGSRIDNGFDKLYNTTERELIALYEASLIRYFYPEFNVKLKDSFPSTDLVILRDCYDKDFSAVVAELALDKLPFTLISSRIDPKPYHIIIHNLHKNEDRRMFFCM